MLDNLLDQFLEVRRGVEAAEVVEVEMQRVVVGALLDQYVLHDPEDATCILPVLVRPVAPAREELAVIRSHEVHVLPFASGNRLG